MSDQGQRIGGTDFIKQPSPSGMGLHFHLLADGTTSGKVTMDIHKQGPPGHVHGGAMIAMLDEAMGSCAWASGYRVVAVNLQFDLKKAVPLGVEITVRGRVDSVDGRKVWTSGEVVLPGGVVAVTAHGLFLEAPEYVGGSGDYNPFLPE